jgi:nitrous oxidase accessory protein
VRGHRNVIENLVIDNCLFGIDLKQSSDNVVRGNNAFVPSRASSACAATACACGTATATWSRATRSSIRATWWPGIPTTTSIRGNVGMRSRYSIHFMFANNNIVEGNRFYDNAVGVYLMYTEGGVMRNNLISHATGATGMAHRLQGGLATR